jgi:transglutaminase-like putative cysteine protease
MHYTIRHVTRFSYEPAITESVMEARMQPRSEATQRCIQFGLSTSPSSRVMMHQDQEGNIVHHFNIPGRHALMTLTAQALVECTAPPDLPDELDEDAWRRLDALTASGEHWDLTSPSTFARPTPLLQQFAGGIALDRGRDPLTTLRRLAGEMSRRFEYSPQSTRVDSPIDDALASGRGVCQDFAHIFIALARQLGVPCRYVSGYLFPRVDGRDRSADGATHAWVEALMPEIGWVGFDPTNDVLAGDRHIRVAIGRDYADVPPTRGVFKGNTAVKSELAVAVRVGPAQTTFAAEALSFTPWMSREAAAAVPDESEQQQQQ